MIFLCFLLSLQLCNDGKKELSISPPSPLLSRGEKEVCIVWRVCKIRTSNDEMQLSSSPLHQGWQWFSAEETGNSSFYGWEYILNYLEEREGSQPMTLLMPTWRSERRRLRWRFEFEVEWTCSNEPLERSAFYESHSFITDNKIDYVRNQIFLNFSFHISIFSGIISSKEYSKHQLCLWTRFQSLKILFSSWKICWISAGTPRMLKHFSSWKSCLCCWIFSSIGSQKFFEIFFGYSLKYFSWSQHRNLHNNQ